MQLSKVWALSSKILFGSNIVPNILLRRGRIFGQNKLSNHWKLDVYSILHMSLFKENQVCIWPCACWPFQSFSWTTMKPFQFRSCPWSTAIATTLSTIESTFSASPILLWCHRCENSTPDGLSFREGFIDVVLQWRWV